MRLPRPLHSPQFPARRAEVLGATGISRLHQETSTSVSSVSLAERVVHKFFWTEFSFASAAVPLEAAPLAAGDPAVLVIRIYTLIAMILLITRIPVIIIAAPIASNT